MPAAARQPGPVQLGTADRAAKSLQAVSLLDRQVIGSAASAKAPAMRADADASMVLSEDFSKFAKGTEAAPDAEGIVGEIPAELTKQYGWAGATVRQAGGCAFIDAYKVQYQGQTIDAFYLDTPWLQLKNGQSLVQIRFRARSTKAKGDVVYIINGDAASGNALSNVQLSISSRWNDYTMYVSDCTPNTFFEFQGDSAPFYIDDIEISVVAELATPEVLPATEISADGFTANWKAVPDATGYILSPKAIHISNGLDPRYLIDADFNSITEGSITSPKLPEYSVYSLDDYISQKGWLVRLPYFAAGCLGLSNELMSTYGNSLLQSPTLNLAGDNGNVSVSMRYQVKDVDMFQVCLYSVLADGRVSLRATKMVYTGDRNYQWQNAEFTIGGGTASSMLVVILPETTQGTVFFDDLRMWQMLEEGTRYTEPMAQIESPTNSARVATPDASENDSFSYSVLAYRTLERGLNIYSQTSDEIVVGSSTSQQPTELATPAPRTVSVDGGRFTATWEPVEGANAYRVDVYRRHESNGFETVDVINENFDGIKVGTTDLDRPRAMSEDGYDRLDAYTKQPGWEVFQGFYVDGAVGILGYWNMLGVGCYMRSPEFDLSANGGKMTLDIKVGSDYYNQGATIYLAHEDKTTGGLVYDEMFPMDEMEKGFHNFTTQFSKGREDSFFIFYPYGYGLSYFDDIHVSQQLPAGVSDIRVSTRTANGTSVTMTVPDVVLTDEYYYTVTALWIDASDIVKVESPASAMTAVEGLVKTSTYAGKVTDAEGNAVAGATVRLVNNAKPSDVVSASTNRWGLFRVENIGDFSATYTPLASAPGYLTAMAPAVEFAGGKAVEEAEFKLRPAAEGEKEVGLPTKFSTTGALYLRYNNSDSETIYPTDALGLPKGAKITAIAYDGYCDTEKDVNYRMEIYLANTEDATYSEATPADKSAMTLFASATKKIAKDGDATLPVELVRFENPEGFEYEGGNLRVLTTSRSNKTNSVFFLMDVTRPSQSIYRNWSSTESNSWKVNPSGMPMLRLEYESAGSSSIDCVGVEAAKAVSARGLQGAIEFTAPAECSVRVYDLAGVCVATVALSEGTTTVSGFAPGVYMIPGSKILVK